MAYEIMRSMGKFVGRGGGRGSNGRPARPIAKRDPVCKKGQNSLARAALLPVRRCQLENLNGLRRRFKNLLDIQSRAHVLKHRLGSARN